MLLETNPKKDLAKEAHILEELFLDQLTFKLGAILNLYTFQKKSKRELLSFVDQLKRITWENLKLLKKQS